MNIIIKKHFLFYKGYKLKCSIGKSGLSHSKKEGDLTTPKGLFKLGLLYYRKDRIKLSKCVIKKRIIIPFDRCEVYSIFLQLEFVSVSLQIYLFVIVLVYYNNADTKYRPYIF